MTTPTFCLPDLITPEKFLEKYWQQKPLLIKQGLPQLVDMFTPDDILELATDPEVSARLITQTSTAQGDKWQLHNSPLTEEDIQQCIDTSTPTASIQSASKVNQSDANQSKLWTVLVQNLEQWSPELASLWQAFDFIPQWARDDIMVSYAQKGGSVGKHYDNYDVFLAQGYGSRRWQLGKYCDENSPLMPNQPLRLLDDMGKIVFDEVLEAGDVLYVPPKLSHYGVAMDDCLTFSFGFRHPNPMQLLDSITDVATTQASLFIPMHLRQLRQLRQQKQQAESEQAQEASGLLSKDSIEQMTTQVLASLTSPMGKQLIQQAIAETVSKRQYPILTADDPLTEDELLAYLADGASLRIDYNSRIIYCDEPVKPSRLAGRGIYTAKIYAPTHTNPNNKGEGKDNRVIYVNGSRLENLGVAEQHILQQLADGKSVTLEQLNLAEITTITLLDWLENGWVWLDVD